MARKTPSTRRYGKAAGEAVARAIDEFEHGTLESGRMHKKVTSRQQAIAIGLSEARKRGAKVPPMKAKPASHRRGRSGSTRG